MSSHSASGDDVPSTPQGVSSESTDKPLSIAQDTNGESAAELESTENEEPRKPVRRPKRAFLCSSLDQAVIDAISGAIPSAYLHRKGWDDNCTHSYETSVMGKFECKKRDCSRGSWKSKKVAIIIRRYEGNGYNVMVFNQRCEECEELGALEIDEDSYVKRVVYRLKKWAGIPVDMVPYVEPTQFSHKDELCEGCKRGLCSYDPWVVRKSVGEG